MTIVCLNKETFGKVSCICQTSDSPTLPIAPSVPSLEKLTLGKVRLVTNTICKIVRLVTGADAKR